MNRSLGVGLVVVLCAGCAVGGRYSGPGERSVLFRVGDVPVFGDGESVFFESGMDVNADGAPNAYHPRNSGTDYLGNAVSLGNWWALATNSGKPSGTPFVQDADDPYPGYYVSQTALFDVSKPRDDPARYVNANEVPYIVLSGGRAWGVALGDLAMVMNRSNGRRTAAVVAEFGPRDKIGEGSIALAEALGIDSSPRTGGVSADIAYVIFPGSGSGFPESTDRIERRGAVLFERWGGVRHLESCLSD